MCGITGIFAFNEVGRFNMINLSGATDALALRGPDDRGIFNDHFVGLGHRRLSIIDVSKNGHQPMHDEHKRYHLVFNGEIYNFKKLKAGLLDKGYTFFSESDTEVILKLYMEEGPAFISKLNGFFTIALYDKEEKSLFIARDRFGIKPLLYFQDEHKLIFASEMKALMAFGIQKSMDRQSLFQYLQLNYIPGPNSIFENVKKLPPGHSMLIKNGKAETSAYYQIPYDRDRLNSNNLSYDAQQKKLLEILERSVQRRLVSDVPLGSFLSGGIDSSVITALASRHVDKLNTFSIGYRDEPFFDETSYAELVAKKYNTNHTVFKLSNDDLYAELHNILDYIDEPFADSSAIPVYLLSQKTKQKVTVGLSGDGADEVFSGYNKHMAAFKALNGGTAANLVKSLLPIWKMMPKSRNSYLGNKFRQLERFGEGMNLSEKERYWRWAIFSNPSQVNAILNPEFLEDFSEEEAQKRKSDILQNFSGKGGINDFLLTDVQLVLTNDMLTKVDLMSMANSLEVRVPFLDHEVVDFAFSLPADSKINGEMKKRIVQDAFRSLLPSKLYKRPKHGFEVPLLKWFRTELKSMIMDDLLDDTFIKEQGIFDVNGIQALKNQLFSKNPEDVHARIWGLIVFQTWWKKHMA